MVQGPGGYKFLDYTKIGLPLNFSMLVIAGVLIPLIWNIR
jgi:di/tricarboxylate transporter